MAQEICTKVFQMHLPSRAVCPDQFQGQPPDLKRKNCQGAIVDEFDSYDVFYAFFLPHRYLQVPVRSAYVDSAPAIPFARQDEGLEYPTNAEIAFNIPVPAG